MGGIFNAHVGASHGMTTAKGGKGVTMPEEMTANEQVDATESESQERTFTQDEVNALMGNLRAKEREKYADVLADADKWREFQESQKSELEKATEERDALKARIEQMENERKRAADIAEASKKYGVDADILSAMTGDIEQNAQLLKEKLDASPKYGHVPDGGEHKTPAMSEEEIFAIKDPGARIRAIAQNLES